MRTLLLFGDTFCMALVFIEVRGGGSRGDREEPANANWARFSCEGAESEFDQDEDQRRIVWSGKDACAATEASEKLRDHGGDECLDVCAICHAVRVQVAA